MPARFLFVLPPFAGHVIPAVSVGNELLRRGHEVAWAAHPAVEGLLPEGGRRYLLETWIGKEEYLRLRESSGGRWMAGLKAFWTDVMLPLSREMLPQVGRAIDSFEPDVVVADQQALAGALAARRARLPWATSAATFAWASGVDSLPAVKGWIDAQLEGLQREAGLRPIEQPDLSRTLVIAYTTRELAGVDGECPRFRFVGAPIDGRSEASDFPWELLEGRRSVFVSLGTVSHYRGESFLRTVSAALNDLPVQVIITAPRGLLADAPSNVIIRDWVPQLALLEHADAVICNAGFSTTGEALARGVPLVLAPIAYDSSIVAERVVATGAGVRVRFYRCTEAELRVAVEQVLNDSSYRRAATTLQEANERAGGARAAADALETTFLERQAE